MKACTEGNQKSFISRVHWPYSLLSSSDVNEEDCQSWQIEGMKQAQRQGTDFISKCLHFTPPFCLPPLLIALEQQGGLQVKLSLKQDHYQLFCLAGEKSSACSVGSLTGEDEQGARLSSERTRTTTHGCSQYDSAFISTCWSPLWHQQKPSKHYMLGSSLKVGPCSFRHVDTLGEILSATDRWKQR